MNPLNFRIHGIITNGLTRTARELLELDPEKCCALAAQNSPYGLACLLSILRCLDNQDFLVMQLAQIIGQHLFQRYLGSFNDLMRICEYDKDKTSALCQQMFDKRAFVDLKIVESLALWVALVHIGARETEENIIKLYEAI